MSVDAHCHVDLHPNPQQIVDLAVSSKLRVVAVTTTPAAFKGSVKFSDSTNSVFPALGMHPELIATRQKDMVLFEKYLDQVTWVGEVGLDGSQRFRSSWNNQVAVFEEILKQCARAGGKILSIHSRSASCEVVELIRKNREAGEFVLHWFSGSLKEVDLAVELGAYFSINDQMLKSKSGVAICRRIPADRLLTESDAPFAQGDVGQSLVERIQCCVSELATIHRCSDSDLNNQVDSNFATLISAYT
ncbi:MAG: Qat anti-phage system TatD family nuclease QatD [Pirellulaceae bacterium]|nr:Qat anti-phage system TatD family nuclease QatD [Pirellulaceae bacterium]